MEERQRQFLRVGVIIKINLLDGVDVVFRLSGQKSRNLVILYLLQQSFYIGIFLQLQQSGATVIVGSNGGKRIELQEGLWTVLYYGNYLIGFSVSLQRGCLDDFSYGTPVTEHPFGAVGTQGQLIRCFQRLLQIPFYRFIIKELKQCGIGSYE